MATSSSRRRSQHETRPEFAAMVHVLDRIRGAGDTAIIAVTRSRTVQDLRIEYPRPGFFTRLLKGQATIAVTNNNDLRHTVNNLRLKPGVSKMVILVSEYIEKISFRARGSNLTKIKELTILHCIDADEADLDRPLLISGNSVFNGVRFDAWEAVAHEHRLVLGPNVRIKIDLNDNSVWRNGMKNHEATDLEEAGRYLRNYARPTDWEQWKGVVSAVLGVAAGAGTFVVKMQAAAAGVFVQYNFGFTSFKFAAGYLHAATVVTAVGTGAVVGAAAAAAVYFIPWGSLTDFVNDFISRYWQGIRDLWSRFCSWVESFFCTTEPLGPMAFGN